MQKWIDLQVWEKKTNLEDVSGKVQKRMHFTGLDLRKIKNAAWIWLIILPSLSHFLKTVTQKI